MEMVISCDITGNKYQIITDGQDVTEIINGTRHTVRYKGKIRKHSCSMWGECSQESACPAFSKVTNREELIF